MAHDKSKPLRFAALIRVSTEKQEAKGESLRTQEKQIKEAVNSLGGRITKTFSGQEHAVEGYERKMLDELLDDTSKKRKPFDAVMIADPSRWSRDNERSKGGLKILKNNRVRFFSLTTEYDLYDPNATLFLGMAAEFGEFQARTQKKKALDNKVERARRGIPTAGSLPFGRTFDRETGEWSIVPEQKEIIEDIAERYLDGESLNELAKEFPLSYSQLWKILTRASGDTWPVRFKADDLDIDETITMMVPRLLPQKTIRAVKQRMEAARTYRRHGQAKHEYLLGGFVRCSGCGRLMTGAVRPSGMRLYRHNPRAKDCPLRHRPSVRADELEQAVIGDLFKTFGNPAAIKRAIKAAVPDCDKLIKERKRIESDLERITKARNRILGLIEKDALTDDQAENKLKEFKEKEEKFNARLDGIDAQTQGLPDTQALDVWVEEIEDALGTALIVIDSEGNRYVGGNDVSTYLEFWDESSGPDRRALILSAFEHPLPDGTPSGVYISNFRKPLEFDYEIRGLFNLGNKGATKFPSSGRRRSTLR